jgi:co-chaperonin GroES (HSP10)
VAEEPVTMSGLVIPGYAKEEPQLAEVVAGGDNEATINVAPGNLVLFAR